ncbi:MAG: glycoside hydrolase family 28 protein [Spirochaetaceae bacterium]|jgi:polygalacturonase|nr:glycoside hydrolase family 28 protein [Spirochaetaceae bacterium]
MPELNIASFGGTADGVTDNSGPLAAALQTLKEAGGGCLRIGEGVWRTGPIEISSGVTIALDEGAVLSFIPEPERYSPVWTRWEGLECYAMHPCVFADGQEDIAITGKGVLDGNGLYWWDMLREKRALGQQSPQSPQELALAALNRGYETQQSGGGGRKIQFLRPPLLQFLNCSKIRLEGVTLQNSPFWTLHPLYCHDVVISGLTVKNPFDAPNTDGMDIDSCEDVLIENCTVSVGDDGIVLKSGAGEDGMRVGKPCRRITVRNCTIEDGHGGIVIGSETAAGVSEVVTEECLFRGTDRGIRIKTRRGRGGKIHDLEFRKLTMENNLCPLAINMFYRPGAALTDGYFSQNALPVNAATPSIKNIHISDIRASGCRASAGFIAGLPESPVENVSIDRCEISTDELSGVSPDESDMFLGIPAITEKSIRLLNVKNIQFNEVNVRGPAEAFIYR